MKIGLALLFVSIVALVAWSYLRRAYQTYRFLSQPEKLAAGVARLAKGFEYVESRDGKPVFKVIANRSIELRQGANILEGVELYKYDAAGQIADAIKSGRAVYQVQQKLVEFDQRVELRLGNGITVRTEYLKANLNAEQAEIPNGYFFESGKFVGHGSRLYYKMRMRELEMRDRVELFVKNGGQIESYLRSNEAVLVVPKNQIFLQGNVFFKKQEGTLRAGSVELAYDFDHHRLTEVKAREDAVITHSGLDGSARTLTAKEITLPVVGGHAASFDAVGGMRLARVELRDQAQARSLEAKRIKGQLDGRGDITMLNSSEDVHFSDLPAGPKIQAQASSALFAGGRLVNATFSNHVRLEDEARSVVIQSDGMSLAFSSGGEVEKLEGTGSATLRRVAPNGGMESELSADLLEGSLGPGAELKSASGTGKAVLRLQDMVDKSTRTVAAGRIVGQFDAAGELNRMHAEESVQLTLKNGNALRQTYSDFLEAQFFSGQITWFRQWPNFRLDDGQNILTGEIAIYQDGVMTVARRNRQPTLTQRDARITARRFLLYERDNKLSAQGDVKTEIRSSASADSTFPTFSGNQPIFIQSDDLQLAQGSAAYTGKVKAYQKNDFLFAERIVLQSGSGMVASGSVRTVFYRSAKGELKRITITAALLTYDRNTHVARYSGDVRMLTGDGTVLSKTLDLYFNQDNQVENAVARERVEIYQANRVGTGNEMEYNFAANQITLSGNLAQIVDSSRGKTRGRRLTFFAGSDRILVES
ncbi:MAG: hypothetical protein HY644_09960 [Acidobacteria bacterium]|nr:hypothetical protein [Acidobacteriota bacterium]